MATFQKDGLWVQGGQGALANVNEQTPFVPGQLGRVMSIRTTDGKVPRFYQYVKTTATTTVAPAANQVAYWADYDDFIVTPDSGTAIGGTTVPAVAGVFLGALSGGYYGFVQVGGPATLSVADTNTLLGGELLIASGTQFVTIGAFSTATDGANPGLADIGKRRVGQALGAAASATTATVVGLLDVVHLGW